VAIAAGNLVDLIVDVDVDVDVDGDGDVDDRR